MPELLYTLAVLACPVGMGLMMWMMHRGAHGGGQVESPAEKQAELSALRAEIDALRADREESARPRAEEPSR